jgi:hypothetical protein
MLLVGGCPAQLQFCRLFFLRIIDDQNELLDMIESVYAGTVAFSCSVTTSPAGATDAPTCTAGPSVTMNSCADSTFAGID